MDDLILPLGTVFSCGKEVAVQYSIVQYIPQDSTPIPENVKTDVVDNVEQKNAERLVIDMVSMKSSENRHFSRV